jgi:tetratricopeptide (TPR) repeat protein
MQRLLYLQRFALPAALLLITAAAPLAAEPVLVIPFFSRSPDANVDWISESVAHTIQDAFESRGILVLDRHERETVYRRLSIRPNALLTRATIMKVAEEMDASTVIWGEFELTPAEGSRGNLRVSATALDMKRLRQARAVDEEGPLEELASIQSRLAWRILRGFAPDDTPEQEVFLRERPAVRLDAMENYTRGLMASEIGQKRRFMLQAVRLEPNFSDALYELARLYWDEKQYEQAAKWLKGVPKDAPRYFEAMFLYGLCRYEAEDFAGAEQAFETVAEAVPLNEVFNNLGAAQSRRGLPQALQSFETALEGDAADPDYHFNVGYTLLKQGRFEEAAERFRAALERDPDDGDAADMLKLATARKRPSASDAGLERIKINFEERAYRQLKSAIDALKRK